MVIWLKNVIDKILYLLSVCISNQKESMQHFSSHLTGKSN